MRRKRRETVFGLMLMLILSFVLGACGTDKKDAADAGGQSESVSTASSGEASSGEAESEESTSSAEDKEASEEDADILEIPVAEGEDWQISDCIVLGDYKGLSFTRTVPPVTEDEVTLYIAAQETPEEVQDADAVAQLADTVNISYTGSLNGETIEEMSGSNFDLLIGSETFIPGFEDGLIGMKAGETKTLNLTFPDDYTPSEYAGQAAVFEVTVNQISRPPVLTNDQVMQETDGQYTTVAEYRLAVQDMLEQQNAFSADEDVRAQAWEKLRQISDFKALPKEYIEEGTQQLESDVAALMEQNDLEMADYLQAVGLTEEEFAEQKELYGRYVAESKLLLEVFTEAEGLSADSEEYKKEMDALAEAWGTEEEDLVSAYGEEDLREYCLTQIAIDRLLSYAQVTDADANT